MCVLRLVEPYFYRRLVPPKFAWNFQVLLSATYFRLHYLTCLKLLLKILESRYYWNCNDILKLKSNKIMIIILQTIVIMTFSGQMSAIYTEIFTFTHFSIFKPFHSRDFHSQDYHQGVFVKCCLIFISRPNFIASRSFQKWCRQIELKSFFSSDFELLLHLSRSIKFKGTRVDKRSNCLALNSSTR